MPPRNTREIAAFCNSYLQGCRLWISVVGDNLDHPWDERDNLHFLIIGLGWISLGDNHLRDDFLITVQRVLKMFGPF